MNQKKKVSKRQMPLPQNAPKVLVSISLAHASWRDFFSGILRYVDEHANWDIRIAHEPGDLLAGQIDEAERGHYAGIILATPEEVKRRLARPGMTVAEIARECGFKTAAHLSHLFKRQFGISIAQWRDGRHVKHLTPC